MKWCKLKTPVPIEPSTGQFIEEGAHILLTERQCRAVAEIPNVQAEFSDMDQTKIYTGGDIPAGSKVGFYYPAAIGDAACHTAIVARLKDRFPQVEMRVFSPPQSAPIWYLNRSVNKAARAMRPTWDAFNLCDVWMIGDEVTYKDNTSNIYDSLSKHFHVSLNDDQKKPWLFVSEEEVDQTVQKVSLMIGRNITDEAFVLFAPQASKDNRSYPDHFWAKTARSIQERLGCLVIAVGSNVPRFNELRGVCGVLAGALSLRELICLTHQAYRVVTVDSAMLHIAAAFDVPTVALFGPFSPKHRSETYRSCKNIWYNRVCPESPCCYHEEGLPFNKCPKGVTQYCWVLEQTTPDMVVDELKFLEKEDKIIQCNPIIKTYEKA